MVWGSGFTGFVPNGTAWIWHVLYLMPTNGVELEIHEFSPWRNVRNSCVLNLLLTDGVKLGIRNFSSRWGNLKIYGFCI